MEIHFVIADPAGNITAIVKDGVADDDYRSVAAAIMQDPQWKVEQVGFITEPKVGGEARLQMMGGEFCGNAARSFGKYIAKKNAQAGSSDRDQRKQCSHADRN